MIVGIAKAELHIPHARSLKDKRRIVKSLLDRISHKHRISAAEVAHQDLHQRAELGFALVNSDRQHAAATLENIHRVVADRTDAFLTDWSSDVIEDFG